MIFKPINIISIDQPLHDDKDAYVKEGHGGKPVREWPIYRFFQHHYSGDKEEAKKQFESWYLEQYQKYSTVDGKKIEMMGGS